jgi:Ala-tRNA(Pro) deacylase
MAQSAADCNRVFADAIGARVPSREIVMPATPQDLFDTFDALGIRVATHDHAPLFTVEESKALRGSIPGGHSKNLFLKDRDGRLFLLVAEEVTRVDLKNLHLKIGARGRLSFGAPDLLEAVWGVQPGAVTPFGALNDRDGRVTVLLDPHLMAHGDINFHPLVNTRTTTIRAQDLIAFLRATGHEPVMVDPRPPDADVAL